MSTEFLQPDEETSETHLLRAEGLTKQYGKRTVVEDVDAVDVAADAPAIRRNPKKSRLCRRDNPIGAIGAFPKPIHW